MKTRIHEAINYRLVKFRFCYEHTMIDGDLFPKWFDDLEARNKEASRFWTLGKVVRFL